MFSSLLILGLNIPYSLPVIAHPKHFAPHCGTSRVPFSPLLLFRNLRQLARLSARYVFHSGPVVFSSLESHTTSTRFKQNKDTPLTVTAI
ncbi:hypothetical protein EV361DRAFT_100692 [Lentinula raphanica]|nr:hypothetical protein EV361DRAFT_100692 [Lentinula raphanica]